MASIALGTKLQWLGLGRCLRRPHQPSDGPASPYVISQRPKSQPQAHVYRLRSINACRNRLIEPPCQVQSSVQRRMPLWRRGESVPAVWCMVEVVGEQVSSAIRSHPPCAQDVPYELLLDVRRAQWPLLQGLLGAFHPHAATFLLRTLASDPSSLRGLVKRCATAKSHGIRFPWVWA